MCSSVPVARTGRGERKDIETGRFQIGDRDRIECLSPSSSLERRAPDTEGDLIRIRDDRIQRLIVTSSKSGDYRRQTDEKH